MKAKILFTALLPFLLFSCSSDKGGSEVIDKVVTIEFEQKQKSIAQNNSLDLFTELKLENATKQDIAWYTDNAKVIRLEGSVATGGIEGEALIVAKVKGTAKQATMKLIVKEQLLRFTQDKLTMVSGVTYDLNQLVEHRNITANQIRWTTSDSNIVSVDKKGEIRTNREGNARVVVYLEDSPLKAEIAITVKKNELETIVFPASTLEMYAMDNITIPYEVIPNGASTEGMKWEVENNNRIKVVAPGLLYSDELGSGVLKVTLPNGVIVQVNIRVVSKGISDIKAPYGVHLDIFEGRNRPLTLNLLPLGETAAGLDFTTDNSIIEISEEGMVYTTVGQHGIANVMIKAKDNPSVKLAMEVEVHPFSDFISTDINMEIQKFNNDLYSGNGVVTIWKQFPEEVTITSFKVFDGYKRVIYSNTNSYELDQSYTFDFERVYKPYIEYTVVYKGHQETQRVELRNPLGRSVR